MDKIFLQATEMLSLLAMELRRDRPLTSGNDGEQITATAESVRDNHRQGAPARRIVRSSDKQPRAPWTLGPRKLRDGRAPLEASARPYLARPYRGGARRAPAVGRS
jgi:hypothetical protein